MIKKECCICEKEFIVDETKKECGTNEEGHFFGLIPLSMANDPFFFSLLDPGKGKKWILPKSWNKFWNRFIYWIDDPGERCESRRTCTIWEAPYRLLISWIKEKIEPTPFAEYWECNECYNKTGGFED